MIGTPRTFLESVSGYVSDSMQADSSGTPYRLATIDPYYTSGLPHVLFDGETVVTAKGYAWADGYNPIAGDRVILAPVGTSYIIQGAITSNVPYSKFIPLTLTSPWVNYDAVNYHPASFTKTTSGVVKLSGLIKGAYQGIIGYLPVGFRPLSTSFFSAYTGYSTPVWSICVNTSGTVFMESYYNSDPGWISLDNIIFPTDPLLQWINPPLLNGFNSAITTTIAYTKDSFNRVWIRGSATAPATQPTVDTSIFQLPSGYRPQYRQHQELFVDGNGFGFHDMSQTGDYRWKVGSSFAPSAYMDLDDSMFHTDTTGWSNGTYLNGWVSYDTNDFAPASYRKDADGIVYLRGLIKAGTMGWSAFQLPAGYRPAKRILRSSPSASAPGRVDILTSGDVCPINGSNAWVSVDGISFPAEQ